jgi:formylglycine-generating enzyme required for sulfatase activity
MPVDDFADDRSVYDVWGLAGNVRTLCGNAWTAEGPAQDGERLVHRPAPEDVEFVAVRGGAFGSSPALSRAAVRFGDAPTTRYTHRGLRLARSL